MPRSLRIEFPGAFYHGENGVSVQILTEFTFVLSLQHATENGVSVQILTEFTSVLSLQHAT
jgi:hypothetical protein